MFYTTNGGRTWRDTGLLPGFGAYSTTSDISIAFGPDGVAYACVLAVDGKRSGIFVSRSENRGKNWSNPATVFLDTSGATFSDKPWIVVDQTSRPSAGTLYVAWNLDGTASAVDGDSGITQALHANFQTGETPQQGLVLARSTDGARTFSTPVLVKDFDTTFPLGAIPVVSPNGHLTIAYSTQENASGTVDHIEIARSKDQGLTFSYSSIKVNGIPNHLGSSTFRSLSLPAFAVSPRTGSMVLTWADQGSHQADILSSVSTDGGITWSSPTRVNHDRHDSGRDHFQPVLAVAPNGTYTCAWFDRRRDPRNRRIDEEIAQSTDDGHTFTHNFRVTRRSWDPSIDAPRPEGKLSNTFIGDYQALAVDNTTVHPVWNDTQNSKSQEIRTAMLPVALLLRYSARANGR
ncbi:MAG: hypothetical protein NVS2B16_02100 [Chloroflexota bacterium]